MAEIKIRGKLPPTPARSAHIYRLKKPAVTEKSIRALARQLGMRGDIAAGRLASDADKLTYSEAHLDLTVYRASGGVRLIDRSRWQVDDGKSDLQIDDAAAARLAAAIVRRNKLAPSAEARFLKAARLRVGHATREGTEVSERTIDVGVALQRLVDKVPVDGPGGKLVVYLDREHKPSAIERLWRPLAGTYRRNVPHRSPESAIRDMAAHYRRKQGTIEIQEVRYGYFEYGWRAAQQYLQPAYVIFGMLTSPETRVRKRMIFVAPALEKPAGAITPPLARKPPQRKRAER